MNGARILAVCGIAGGVAVSALTDTKPVREPITVEGYQVLSGDFHVHAFVGDGGIAPWMLQRQAARVWFSSARHFVPDKQGRFAIPQPLREFARLERDVMVLGVDNRIELWNPVRWREVEADAQTDIQAGAGLDDIGFI